MSDSKDSTQRILESKLGKELADPQRWRAAMLAAWAKHPDPRMREFARQWEQGASIRDLASSHRALLEDGLRIIGR